MANGIIDFYNGKTVMFDGYGFIDTDPKINHILGQTIIDSIPTNQFNITIFVGMLHLSSKKIYSTGKSGIIRKEFTPFVKQSQKILVKTKKIDTSIDIHAVVKLDEVKDNILYCSVLKYLENDNEILNALSCSHWTTKLNNKFGELKTIDLTPERKDMTHIEIYSIDPKGCEDIDDALHVIEIDDLYEIGIHIADVSSFVEEGSEYDIELSKRVETIYLDNDLPMHMIPPELSINNISLKNDNIKRAFSTLIKIDKSYNIVSISFEKTIINVTKNLSYDDAQYMIDNRLNRSLSNLYTIGLELKKTINKAFNPLEPYDIHQMVAVYMILTNKIVAETIKDHSPKNVLLRTQHIDYFESTMDDDIPFDLIKKHEMSFLERAIYKIGLNDCDHMGLGLKYYTHFTSPIRRYADILVHRQLWNFINSLPISKIDTKTLFLMNYYSHYYKRIERYSNLVNIVNMCTFDVLETTAIITSIKNTSGCVRLYIPELKLDYDHYVINRKMENLLHCEYYEDKLIIKNTITEDTCTLLLFQKINIIISFSRNVFEKINLYIKDICL